MTFVFGAAAVAWEILACPPGVTAAAREPWLKIDAALVRTDSLLWAGATGQATAVLDSLDRVAAARADARLREAILLQRSVAATNTGQYEDAERVTRDVMARSRARRDTVLWCQALLVKGRTLQRRERLPDADRDYQAALTLALRARLAAPEGWARRALAHNRYRAGKWREALDGFRRALRAFDRADAPDGALWAHQGLAQSLEAMGDVDEALREYEFTRQHAKRMGDRFLEVRTLMNQASIEHSYGNPARAAELLQRARRECRDLGRADWALMCANELAKLHHDAGRFEEADSLLTAVLPEAERGAYRVGLGRVLFHLSEARRERGRLQDALALGRRALALSDTSMYLSTTVDVVGSLAETLTRAGRVAEAESFVAAQTARLAERADAPALSPLLVVRASLLRELGRPREGLALLGAPAGDSTGTRGLSGIASMARMTEVARCWAALGQRERAMTWFRRAELRWNEARVGLVDPEWRERLDQAAWRFGGAYAAVQLDGARGAASAARAGTAFNTLQRFRARTLMERTYGPGRGSRPPRQVDAGTFARTVLRPGEVFVDAYATPETTIVFAMTRRSLVVWGAPRRSQLLKRLRVLRDLHSRPGNGAGPGGVLARGLGEDLLGPANDLLRANTHVLISAGVLAQFPLGALIRPGAAEPLAVERVVSFVPSATLLAEVRGRARTPVPQPGAILAVARTHNDRGDEIRAAGSEARWLSRRFRGSVSRVDDEVGAWAALKPQLGRYEVIHLAVHARPSPNRPWRSGLLLGSASARDPYVHAAEIARLSVPSRLCVLAGCSTLLGSGEGGETPDGLAAAWLAAGVPTVVATQWAVDDRATFELMREFYERLASGLPAAEALRAAQAALRARSEWAAPAYWQGFVIVGEPGTRVALPAAR